MSLPLSRVPDNYLDRHIALQELAQALRGGYLVLFLGAGVSLSTRSPFPSWAELVKRCCESHGVPIDPAQMAQERYLLNRAEAVEQAIGRIAMADTVEECLYRGVEYDTHVMKNDLLIALGSLAMKSIRGAARAVVSYNFDDLLEWYLSYHGLQVTPVSSLPSIRGSADVSVFHPHGFLPKTSNYKSIRTSEIVFSRANFLAASAAEVDPWNELQRSFLSCNCALFVGLSGEDEHLQTLWQYSYEKLLRKTRLLGFIVGCRGGQFEAHQQENLWRGVANLYVDTVDDIPDLLLEVCRAAAGI